MALIKSVRLGSAYKIYSYDTSKKAIDLAKKGVYTIFRPMSFDQFLMSDFELNTLSVETQQYTKDIIKKFSKVMEMTTKPKHTINDPDFEDYIKTHSRHKFEYYKIKDEFKKNFDFEVGDIKDIENLAQGKKVKITDGPFKNMIGKVNSYDLENKKVELLLDLFGQETSVEVKLSEIENLK